MEVGPPPPSSQNPSSDLSIERPPAQPRAEPGPEPEPEYTQTQSLPQAVDATELYRRIASYPFYSDQDYLVGLAAILGHPETPPTTDELSSNADLALQAQCFYLTRKFNLGHIDVEGYRSWLAEQPQPQSQSQQPSPPPQPHISETPGINNPSTNGTSSPPPRPSAPTPTTASAATNTLPIQPHQQQTTAAEPPPPYPTSFADIVDLITTNKPIPGIEEIPSTVLDLGSSKADKTPRRRKPWEKDTAIGEDQKQTGTSSGNNDDQDAERSDRTLDTEDHHHQTDEEEEQIDVETRKMTGEGVMKILQPGAVPDSGLIAKE